VRITKVVSVIDVVGYIWMPSNVLCAMTYTLSDYDVGNIRAYGDGQLTRAAVEHWLGLNSGDFSEVVDFRVDIGDGDLVSDFTSEESEFAYLDAMYGGEDD
jgi:hypothetical protein